jgi:hypothetical protein
MPLFWQERAPESKYPGPSLSYLVKLDNQKGFAPTALGASDWKLITVTTRLTLDAPFNLCIN